MKSRILALFLVLLFVLAGCAQKPAKTVVPISSQYEDTADQPTDDATSDVTSDEDTTTDSKVNYETTGGQNVFEGLMEDEDEGNKGFEIIVEKNSIPSTLSTKWEASSTSPVKGGATAQAAAMREKVLNTKNTADYYKWKGKTFYVSPNGDDKNDGLTPKTAVKTLNADAIYMYKFQTGDAVLFERGGVWRMSSPIKAKEGVIYGSYGTGEKPTLVGSVRNYADPKFWTASSKENIWKITVADTDIGLIVCNHGELTGWKKYNGVTVLEKNGDFYYNNNDDTIYFYFDKGNPGKYFKDIEIGLNTNAFTVTNDNVVIDNFRIKYYAHHGISMGGNNNTKITNCELGFIGGATQTGTTRLGNAIQQWNMTDKQLIENNWIYQAYDTGYTWQGADGTGNHLDPTGNHLKDDEVVYKDITVKNNLIEYCAMAVEYWHNDNGVPVLCKIENFDVSDNIFTYSGYGWSRSQRPDKVGAAIQVRERWFPNATGCKIKNNIFDVSSRYTLYWGFSGGPHGEWDISGNTFYEAKGTDYQGVWYGSLRTATSQASFSSALSSFDSKPAKVQWLTK